MNTRTFPMQSPSPQWSSQDLADAVPLRLSDAMASLLRFPADLRAANGIATSSRTFGWRRRNDLAAFRVC